MNRTLNTCRVLMIEISKQTEMVQIWRLKPLDRQEDTHGTQAQETVQDSGSRNKVKSTK